MQKPRMIITIEVMDEEEKQYVVADIINQLIDNDDYIRNNIIVEYKTANMIDIYIYEECENMPRIVFPNRES